MGVNAGTPATMAAAATGRSGVPGVEQRAPLVEIESIKDTELSFVLSGTDTSVANALRRVMMAEVCSSRCMPWGGYVKAA